ncbi:MAG: glycoside hydrolase family 15 protein [Alphaproteobacteria bacterium]
MAERIEDYAFISDARSAALVSRHGSVDWLSFPRFDSGACFAALLGSAENGRWVLGPAAPSQINRSYLRDTLVLETVHQTDSGSVAVIDTLVAVGGQHRMLRVVEGRSGNVGMRMELVIRFDYGSIIPWVRSEGTATYAIGGPDAVVLHSPVARWGEKLTTVAEFSVRAGDRIPFELAWHPSVEPAPGPSDWESSLGATIDWWRTWASTLRYRGAYHKDVRGSLLVLKGLSHRLTGAIVAAPTTSLPEWIGSSRNWDYRYCWLRDATFTLLALVRSGCVQEATAWRNWLVRAVAGSPSEARIMYGLAGERRLPETELSWLSGYENSRPVRVGNAAAGQLQLDVFGEVLDALHQARLAGMEPEENAWNIQKVLLEWLEGNWRRPDQGIWEVRSEPAHFTHSKIMAWVAFDRGVRAIEETGLTGDIDTWRARREEIRSEILVKAVDADGVFTRSYGSRHLDASALVIPLVGFLPPDDKRVVATVEAIQDRLTVDGFVRRYEAASAEDGVGGEEGTFLLCSFWLVDCLALMGRRKEAVRLFERLLGLRNDLGLLAEEYDPTTGRQLGNFPQAFSHVALASSAMTLCPDTVGPSQQRSRTAEEVEQAAGHPLS